MVRKRTLNSPGPEFEPPNATKRLATLVPLTTLTIYCASPLSGLNDRRTIARVRDLAVEDRVHFVGHILHHRWHDVAVGVSCQRDRAVTEQLHDSPELDALGQQEASGTMSQVMKPDRQRNLRVPLR